MIKPSKDGIENCEVFVAVPAIMVRSYQTGWLVVQDIWDQPDIIMSYKTQIEAWNAARTMARKYRGIAESRDKHGKIVRRAQYCINKNGWCR